MFAYTHAQSRARVYDVTMLEQTVPQKRDEAAFTRYPTHFSSFSPRFSKMSYQSVSDFIFRFTLAIRRCTTIRSFSCFCQPALAQYRPLYALSSERITHFAYVYRASLLLFFSLSPFLLHSNLPFFHNGYHVETDYARAFDIKKFEFIYFIQFLKEK